MGGANNAEPDSSAEDDSDDDQESKEAHEVSAVSIPVVNYVTQIFIG